MSGSANRTNRCCKSYRTPQIGCLATAAQRRILASGFGLAVLRVTSRISPSFARFGELDAMIGRPKCRWGRKIFGAHVGCRPQLGRRLLARVLSLSPRWLARSIRNYGDPDVPVCVLVALRLPEAPSLARLMSRRGGSAQSGARRRAQGGGAARARHVLDASDLLYLVQANQARGRRVAN